MSAHFTSFCLPGEPFVLSSFVEFESGLSINFVDAYFPVFRMRNRLQVAEIEQIFHFSCGRLTRVVTVMKFSEYLCSEESDWMRTILGELGRVPRLGMRSSLLLIETNDVNEGGHLESSFAEDG